MDIPREKFSEMGVFLARETHVVSKHQELD